MRSRTRSCVPGSECAACATQTGSTAWGPDGTLVWQADGGVVLLKPGAFETVRIEVDDVMFPIRWSDDGRSIVALGNAGLCVVSVDEATSRLVELPVRPLHGIQV